MVIALMGGDIDTALAGVERALMLNPNGFIALNHNGWVQCAAGRPEAAIEPLIRALRLSPRDPFRGYCEMALAVAYRDSGRPQEALTWGRRAMLSLPALQGGYRAVAAALVDLGRIDEARGVVGQLLQADPKARVRPAFIRRQNRNQVTVESLISALRAAGLPD
jgi:tetratricopeptide (TPR) repeat protein